MEQIHGTIIIAYFVGEKVRLKIVSNCSPFNPFTTAA